MKTMITLVLVAILSLGFALTSVAGIAGSAHDLTGLSGTGSDEICIYCHTPHNSTNENGVPLWSMTELAANTGYTAYSSQTLDASIPVDVLVGPSRVCMTCHDGTIAMNSAIVDYTPVTMESINDTTAVLGKDLSNDHPIGFDYTAVSVTVDSEIKDEETSPLGNGMIVDALYQGTTMTCASCHEVHEPGNSGYFLLTENTGSALCLACHDK